jgi:O-antigen/teichoic acid export membrane protein
MHEGNETIDLREEERPGKLGLAPLRRRLLSGSAWALGGKVATTISGLATMALLARLLSPQDLGAYFLAMSVVITGATVGSLGINHVAVRFVSESMGSHQYLRARHVVGRIVCISVLGALAAAAIYLALGNLLGNGVFHVSALASATELLALWIAVVALQGVLADILRGFQDIRLATIFSGPTTGIGNGPATGILLAVCLLVLWLASGRASLATVVLLAAASVGLCVLLASWFVADKVVSLPRQGDRDVIGTRQLVHVAWPLLLTSLVLFVQTQTEIWIVAAFRSPEEVAIYGAASRIVYFVGVPLVIVNSVVTPFISQLYAQGRREELQGALRYIAALAGIPGFLVASGFLLFGGHILALVFGDFYQQAATVLTVLSIGLLVSVWVGSGGFTLMMTGHQVLAMAIATTSAAITAAAALVAVGPYGLTGVAVASGGGWAMQNILMWLATKYKTGMWTHVGYIDLIRSVRSEGTPVRLRSQNDFN